MSDTSSFLNITSKPCLFYTLICLKPFMFYVHVSGFQVGGFAKVANVNIILLNYTQRLFLSRELVKKGHIEFSYFRFI